MTQAYKYRRVLLKLSGEALMGEAGYGIDPKVVDEVYLTSTEKAGNAARAAASEEGIFVGISSGAALECALTVAKRPEFKGKRIVALLPDTGERYLSTWLWTEK